ncbi:MAG: hypothetical protein AB7R69_05200, partial [Candidatus Babeliales bacterium]
MFAVVVFGQGVIFGADQQIIQYMQKLKQIVAQKYNVQDPDPVIRKIAEDALDKCGFEHIFSKELNKQNSSELNFDLKKQEVVFDKCGFDRVYLSGTKLQDDPLRFVTILQSNTRRAAESFLFLPATPKLQNYFLIIGVDGALDEIEGTIYHELGHLAYEHGYLDLKEGMTFEQHIAKEKEADEFGYRKLIEHEKVYIALGRIADGIASHEFILNLNENDRLEYEEKNFKDPHPTALERARMGLDILQEKGFKIAELM